MLAGAVKGSHPINLAQLPLLFSSYSVSLGVPVSKLIELEVPPGAGRRSYGFMSEKRLPPAAETDTGTCGGGEEMSGDDLFPWQ